MRLTRVVSPLIVLAALALPATVVHAQRYWHDDQGKDAIRLDFGLPFLKGDGHKFFTGTFVPSMSYRAGDGFRVEADIPIARGAVEGESSLRLGNPYIGLRIGEDDKPVSGILAARIPMSKSSSKAIDDLAMSAGAISDYDDFEAYSPNVLTFRGGLEYHRTGATGWMFGARGVGSLQMNTGGDPTADSEMYFDYGARMGYAGARALAYVALTGRYLITAPEHTFVCDPTDTGCDPKGFNERTHNQVTGTVELRTAKVRPRISLRVPFDQDLRDIAGAILHVGVAIDR
ncbi:MAG TPA: hypothetical protein VF187_06890 [Gemmatimonadales bacterium]